MSRIGRMPIAIPAGVTVSVENNVVTVKGPRGELSEKISPRMELKLEGAELTVVRPTDEKEDKSLHGLTRALVNNMVVGVTEGYSKTLEVIGTGYKATKAGKTLKVYVGHSLMPKTGEPQEKLTMVEPEGITFTVEEKAVPVTITVSGNSKQQVGQIAAVIRGMRPPEPYHGKGIRYKGEQVRRKEATKSTK